MSETVANAAVVSAASLSPTTPVVTAAAHKSIVASLEADIAEAETYVVTAWQTHNVVVVAVIAFVAGFAVHFVF